MHSSSSQKMNIGVSRDMQSTNYTIKKQIQIHCELVRPTSCHKSHFKNRSVFGNTVVWLNVRPLLTKICHPSHPTLLVIPVNLVTLVIPVILVIPVSHPSHPSHPSHTSQPCHPSHPSHPSHPNHPGHPSHTSHSCHHP